MRWVGKDALLSSMDSKHWTSVRSAAAAQMHSLKHKKAKEGLSSHNALPFKSTAGNSPPGVLYWASLHHTGHNCVYIGNYFSSWGLGDTQPQNRVGPSQDASFSHLAKGADLDKGWGEWIPGRTLMEVKWVWKTLFLSKRNFCQEEKKINKSFCNRKIASQQNFSSTQPTSYCEGVLMDGSQSALSNHLKHLTEHRTRYKSSGYMKLTFLLLLMSTSRTSTK